MAAGSGQLIVVSGPSGVGKSTLLKAVRKACPVPLRFSISATTRSPRAGEVDGVDYHFLTHAEFAARRARGEFLECFEVFGRGDWYGTLAGEVLPRLAAGEHVLLEIDVNGARQVVSQYPDAITIFIAPNSVESLRERLSRRGSESPESLQRRIAEADRELAAADEFKHRVVNEDLTTAVEQLVSLITSGEKR